MANSASSSYVNDGMNWITKAEAAAAKRGDGHFKLFCAAFLPETLSRGGLVSRFMLQQGELRLAAAGRALAACDGAAITMLHS